MVVIRAVKWDPKDFTISLPSEWTTNTKEKAYTSYVTMNMLQSPWLTMHGRFGARCDILLESPNLSSLSKYNRNVKDIHIFQSLLTDGANNIATSFRNQLHNEYKLLYGCIPTDITKYNNDRHVNYIRMKPAQDVVIYDKYGKPWNNDIPYPKDAPVRCLFEVASIHMISEKIYFTCRFSQLQFGDEEENVEGGESGEKSLENNEGFFDADQMW